MNRITLILLLAAVLVSSGCAFPDKSYISAEEEYAAGWIITNVSETTPENHGYTRSDVSVYNYSVGFPGKEPENLWAATNFVAPIHEKEFGLIATPLFNPAVPYNRTYYVYAGGYPQKKHYDTNWSFTNSIMYEYNGTSNEEETAIGSALDGVVPTGEDRRIYLGKPSYIPADLKVGEKIYMEKAILSGKNNNAVVSDGPAYGEISINGSFKGSIDSDPEILYGNHSLKVSSCEINGEYLFECSERLNEKDKFQKMNLNASSNQTDILIDYDTPHLVETASNLTYQLRWNSSNGKGESNLTVSVYSPKNFEWKRCANLNASETVQTTRCELNGTFESLYSLELRFTGNDTASPGKNASVYVHSSQINGSFKPATGNYSFEASVHPDTPIMENYNMSAGFRYPGTDIQPPVIESLNSSQRLREGKKYNIALRFNETVDINISVKNGTNWTEKASRSGQKQYEFSLNLSEMENLDLKISAEDSSRNNVSYEIERIAAKPIKPEITLNTDSEKSLAGKNISAEGTSIAGEKRSYYRRIILGEAGEEIGIGIPENGSYSFEARLPCPHYSNFSLKAKTDPVGLYLGAQSEEREVGLKEIDTVRATSQDKESLLKGEDQNITGVFYQCSGLEKVILGTNETGNWENKSVYSSPQTVTDPEKSWKLVSFNWSNSSVTKGETVSWRLYALNKSGEIFKSVNKSFKITELNVSADEFKIKKPGLTRAGEPRSNKINITSKDVSVLVNRSDLNWSANITQNVDTESYGKLITPYTQNFSQPGYRWDIDWNLTQKADEVRITAQTNSESKFSYFPERDSKLKFNHSLTGGELEVKINGKEVYSRDYQTGGWRKGVIQLESGEINLVNFKFERESHDPGKISINNVSIKLRSEKQPQLRFRPHNYGNYSFNFSSRPTQEEILEKLTAKPERDPRLRFESIEYPLANNWTPRSYHLTQSDPVKLKYSLSNSTWSRTFRPNISVENRTSRFGEPYNETNSIANINFSVPEGFYSLKAELETRAGREANFSSNFTVYPPKEVNITSNGPNLGIGVSAGDDIYGDINNNSFLRTKEFSGSTNFTLPDIRFENKSFSLSFSPTSAKPIIGLKNYSLGNKTVIRSSLEQKSRLEGEDPYFVYGFETDNKSYDRAVVMAWIDISDTTASDIRGFSCSNWSFSGSCLSEWKEIETENLDRFRNRLLVRGSAESSEAFAITKPAPEPDDDDGGSSGGGGEIGGGSIPVRSEKPEVKVEKGKVKIQKVSLEPNSSEGIEIQNETTPVEKISFSSDEEVEVSATVETAEEDDLPEKPEFHKVHSYLSIESNQSQEISTEIQFDVSEKWMEENSVKKQEVKLYRYNEKWEGLKTDYIRKEDQKYIFNATLPGMSYFLIGSKKDCANGTVYAVNPETESCREYQNSCKVPEDRKEVESCIQWKKENTREDIEKLDQELDTGKAQQLLQRAKQKLESGNYSGAVDLIKTAQITERKLKERNRKLIIGGGILAGIAGILVLGIIYRRGRVNKRLRSDLLELMQIVKQQIRSGAQIDRSIINDLENAKDAVESGEIDQANIHMEEIKRKLKR